MAKAGPGQSQEPSQQASQDLVHKIWWQDPKYPCQIITELNIHNQWSILHSFFFNTSLADVVLLHILVVIGKS